MTALQTSLSPDERQHWQNYYDGLLPNRLRWIIDQARSGRARPQALKPHFFSMLKVLDQAWARPEWQAYAVELVQVLHPFPLWWGYWLEWSRELQAACQALAALGKTELQAEYLAYLADYYLLTGQADEAWRRIEQALALARCKRAVLPFAIASKRTYDILITLNRSAEIPEQLRAAEEFIEAGRAAAHPDEFALARLHLDSQIIHTRLNEGLFREAQQAADQAVERLNRLAAPDRVLQATILSDRAAAYWPSGGYATAAQDLEAAAQIYGQLGDQNSQAAALSDLGLVYWSMSRYRQAELVLRQAIAMTEQVKARWWLIRQFGYLGVVYLARGAMEPARAWIERQLALAMQVDDTYQIANAHGNRGAVRYYLGDYAGALADLDIDRQACQGKGQRNGLACNLVMTSWVYASLGDAATGLQLAEQAQAIADLSDTPPLCILALRCRAAFLPAAEQAGLLRAALDLSIRERRLLDQAGCLVSLSALAQGEEQARLWAEAARLLAEIDALAWLDGRSPQNPPQIALLI